MGRALNVLDHFRVDLLDLRRQLFVRSGRVSRRAGLTRIFKFIVFKREAGWIIISLEPGSGVNFVEDKI